MALDQIAADRRQSRPASGPSNDRRAAGAPLPEVAQELRPGVFARAEEDRVGVRARLVGQRRHVQAAQGDVGAARAVVVGDAHRRGRADVM